MITIVHHEVHKDDKRMIQTLEVKFKADQDSANSLLTSHVAMALAETTIMHDNGNNLRISIDEERKNIVDLMIKFKENTLSYKDIANFLEALQDALDNPSIKI